MTITRFEDIIAWQKARQLCRLIDEYIFKSNWGKEFTLKDQAQRSAGSIMDNIAEGFGRMGNGEFSHFLTIANASGREVQSQLYRALDKKYISEEEFKTAYNLADEACKLINSLSSYLRKSEVKGLKFKKET